MLKRIGLLTLLISLTVAPVVAAEQSSDSTKAIKNDVSQSESGASQDKKDNAVTKTEKAAKDVPAKTNTKKAGKITSTQSSSTKTASGKAGKQTETRLSTATQFAGTVGKRAAGLVAGFSVGLPIAAVRLTMQANSEQAKSIPYFGESSVKPLVWMARVLVIPPSVFSGTVQAPVACAVNAWKESADQPFGKKSFYLGDVDPLAP